MSKTGVSALHEFCAQRKLPAPSFEFIEESGRVFVCRVEVMNMEAEGQGRSKRDAKHFAASNLIKKLCTDHPQIDIQPVEMRDLPAVDMVMKLRDYCVQRQHPLPVFEFVQQGGTPDAPEFIVMCSVASIKRYGISDKKKDAKQKAAAKVFKIIYMNEQPLEHEIQIATIESKSEEIEAERYNLFKTYRELVDANVGNNPPGILLADRHNYFSKFFEPLKTAAKKILSDPTYEDDYERQAMDVFAALKITPRIKKFPSEKSMELMVQIDVDCAYDVIFAHFESKVYRHVLEYFRDMLD